MKAKFFLFFIQFGFLFSICYSQNRKTDSLRAILKTAKEDTNKVNLLNELFNLNYSNNPSGAEEYAKQALLLSEKIGYIKGQGKAQNALGVLYWKQGDYKNSEEKFLSAMDFFKKSGFEKGTANALNNIGIMNHQRGKYAEALKYYFQALKIKESLGNKSEIGLTLNNIGLVLEAQGDYLQAVDYFSKVLKLYTDLNDKDGIAMAYTNFGNVYQETGEYNMALSFHKMALKLHDENNDMYGKASALNNIGNIYEDVREYDKSVEYHLESLKLKRDLDDKYGITSGLTCLGSVYLKKKKYSEAIQCQKEAMQIALEIDDKIVMKSVYEELTKTYAAMQDFKNAYEYHKQYSDIKDSMLNEESSKQITEMQTKYETEKKEQQITLLNKDKELQDAQLNRQKIVIWSVVGGLLVVLILSVFIFRERRKSEKLLLNILPAETARELKANGKAKAKHYESVTVMFTDFKGFTNIAEKLSAEELVSELDFLFKKFDEIISKYPIEKIKTIGDAYMCAGGLPTANSTNAMDVVKAAIEIQKWMSELKTNDSRLNTWELRIGIHTGPVTAGVVGDKKFAYDIWGDTVNTASRMESSGEAGKINISGSTYEFISPVLEERGWEVRHRGKILAKNKGEINMYFVEKSA